MTDQGLLVTFTIWATNSCLGLLLSGSEPTLPVYSGDQLRFTPVQLPNVLALGVPFLIACIACLAEGQGASAPGDENWRFSPCKGEVKQSDALKL